MEELRISYLVMTETLLVVTVAAQLARSKQAINALVETSSRLITAKRFAEMV
jgi:hypothetical protein